MNRRHWNKNRIEKNLRITSRAVLVDMLMVRTMPKVSSE